jgi:hypothetical protein
MNQRTDEWYQARLGKATASRIADLTARIKDGTWGASRENYLIELVLERRTGRPFMGTVTRAMQEGIQREPQARAIYAFDVIEDIVPVGFCPHPRIEMSGASPDAFVGKHGLLEIKCPEPKEHYRMLTGGSIKGGYVKQMQWQMACTERRWCDWVSFYPYTVEQDQLFKKRVMRDDVMIAELERDVIQFLQDVETRVLFLRSTRELLSVLREAAA